ncbi:tetratricopeptide repeat protein [Asticcacaulis sp. EMRT-3]|uniref:tetratricopeptide repeat protein n=1 Tax=Asticcacaulis sp. EMRT-3 TaxID=3040349 RepID=UPI0024AEED41|nr:tetratricopeptide repeat protein [Asticcacaulis sp. EMRT-3]MDI7774647.1 tetratricopeptide repeat protein [Asticcacaulis sp. EMRT-3]
MSDIFDETEDKLRADKWVAIVKKTWPWVTGVLVIALVVALGIWGWQSLRAAHSAKASEAFQAGIDASGNGDDATAKKQFEAAVKDGSPSYKALALMELAGMADAAHKPDEAIKDLDEAAKAAPSPLLRDTAALKAAYISMDTAPYADVVKRLTPLTGKNDPVAPLAKEALALAKLQNGDIKGARDDLKVLSITVGTPDGLKQRAGEIVEAIDSGAIPTALAILKEPVPNLPTPSAMQAATQAAGPPDGAQ